MTLTERYALMCLPALLAARKERRRTMSAWTDGDEPMAGETKVPEDIAVILRAFAEEDEDEDE